MNESHSFERMRMIMDKLIEQNPTKEHKKYEVEIHRLKQENDSLVHTLSSTDCLVKELKCHNESLRNDKSYLQKIVDSLQREKTSLYQIFESWKH